MELGVHETRQTVVEFSGVTDNAHGCVQHSLQPVCYDTRCPGKNCIAVVHSGRHKSQQLTNHRSKLIAIWALCYLHSAVSITSCMKNLSLALKHKQYSVTFLFIQSDAVLKVLIRNYAKQSPCGNFSFGDMSLWSALSEFERGLADILTLADVLTLPNNKTTAVQISDK